MRLLIVTQAVDSQDPVLGFFVRWVEEFSKQCERVEVICLREGLHSLPGNVHVHSLGKEHGSKSRIAYAIRFLRLVWRLRTNYESVFVHMNMEYVLIAGLLWRLLGKTIGLWYTHGTVSIRLRLAIPLTHFVFTASERSMRAGTSKKRVMGHGMDTDALLFIPDPARISAPIVTVGRVSPVKRVDLALRALALLDSRGTPTAFRIIGAGAREYVNELKSLAHTLHFSEKAEFLGPVTHSSLPEIYANASLFLHASETGSLDKAPLEALACGLSVVTTNEELGASGAPNVWFARPEPGALADTIDRVLKLGPGEARELRFQGRDWVIGNHSLERLISRILSAYA